MPQAPPESWGCLATDENPHRALGLCREYVGWALGELGSGCLRFHCVLMPQHPALAQGQDTEGLLLDAISPGSPWL